MPSYQVIARKFRPQSFKDVLGQDAIITTLKNAIKLNRTAQAYLFCGSRGTGKTTLARILAKALNCENLADDFEPCNHCSSCREITSGSSIDVIEIDGASNRGIEDIRQINENVGYTSVTGRYKIYIIDEVHMLTKEAFNALLKTLEEPPPKVKFFFATTEPHKVLATILSRCQRFNLNRIPTEKIVKKLSYIAQQLNVQADPEALNLIAQQAEGGLRDAESLLDQVIAFESNRITLSAVNSIFGLMSKEVYFELDRAGKEGNLAKAFEVSHQVFSQGKDIMHFIEGLIEHFRHILLMKLADKGSPYLALSKEELTQYDSVAQFYSKEQCMNLIEYLLQAQNQLRFSTCHQITLESILLHLMRSHYKLPVEVLVHRLSELENSIKESGKGGQPFKPEAIKATPVSPPTTLQKEPIRSSVSVDPTPSSTDLGFKKNQEMKPVAAQPTPSTPSSPSSKQPNPRHDNLLQFAAVELSGKIQRK